MTSLTARWHRSIKEIPEQQWNSLVGADAIPFYRWSWLEALESSGSIIPEQGWQPLHLALWRDDIPIAVAPLFLKGHSYGEFVFDQTFARLAADLGLRYYPKLLGMSPVRVTASMCDLEKMKLCSPGSCCGRSIASAKRTASSAAISSTWIRSGGPWRRPPAVPPG